METGIELYQKFMEPLRTDEKAAEEMERILLGIYILEVETGKTAYIKQDMNDIHWAATLDYRSFEWLEKDCFEQVMEEK